MQLAIYSLAAHKEFRFLLPAFQLVMPFCGLGVAVMRRQQAPTTKASSDGEKQKGPKQSAKAPIGRSWSSKLCTAMIVLQPPMVILFSLYHQRAQVGVMSYIRSVPMEDSVLFLTPCHSTPYYSYVHRPIRMRFLDCSPPGTEQLLNYFSLNCII